jgi:hypothetical protein
VRVNTSRKQVNEAVEKPDAVHFSPGLQKRVKAGADCCFFILFWRGDNFFYSKGIFIPNIPFFWGLRGKLDSDPFQRGIS